MKQAEVIKQTIAGLNESQWKELYLEHASGLSADIVPFPAEDIQVITNGQKGEFTGQGAIAILDCVMSFINDTYSPASIKNMRVLDYGCGWGRMTRLLPFYFDIDKIVGVDVDERLINSANELLPFLQHKKIESMEPLPFEDASFDIIFANSVFTHLSEKSALFALAELSRILGRNGLIIISVLEKNNMDSFYKNREQRDWITKILGKKEDAESKLQDEGFLWGCNNRWHEYGIAIIKDNWIIRHFEEIGIKFLGTKQSAHMVGTLSFKCGVKL